MTMNAITYGGTTVQFPAVPLRDASDPLQLVQASAMASDGSQYVYNKGLQYRTPHRMTYVQVSDSVLADLRTLYAAADGGRHPVTWYDDQSAAHTCRFSAQIKHVQTGANRNRIELELEEFVDIGSVPSVGSWAAAAATISGAFPCWLLKLTINGTVYWISDHVFAVAGFITGYTLPLVKSWGGIQSGTTGGLNEYKVSDWSVDLLVDPDASPNLRDLANLYELEQYPVELYLWFHGLNPATDPPRLKWKGYIRNHPEMDDTTLRLECESEAARLTKNIGTLVDSVNYPSAAKADVGKVFPIVYGSPRRIPLLGIDVGPQTTLPAAITAIATTFDVSDADGLLGTVVVCDDEHMQVVGVTGNTLTVNRGINNTLPATHSKGAVVWMFQDEYLYACDPVNSIDHVYGKAGEHYINITSICTLYTGQTGHEHPLYPGRAVVSLPGLITMDQLSGLGLADTTNVLDTINVNDGIYVSDTVNVSDTTNVADSIGVSDTINVNDGIGVSDTVGVSDGIGVTTGSHAHTNRQATISQVNNNGQPGTLTFNAGTYTGNTTATAWFNNDGIDTSTHTVLEVQYKLSISVYCNAGFRVMSNGVVLATINGTHGGTEAINVTTTNASAINIHGVDVICYYNSMPPIVGVVILAAERTIRFYENVDSSAASGVAKTGTASKTGAAAKTGSATKTGAAAKTGAASKTGTVTKTGAASKAGAATKTGAAIKTGTISLVGTTTLKSVISLAVSADLTSSTYLPSDVEQDILSRVSGGSLTTVGTFPAWYRLDGAITEYKSAQYWLDLIAFQCRAWFIKEVGTAKLIMRPDVLSPVKTVSACLLDGSKRSLKISKAQLSEVINVTAIRYDRDWSLPRAAENFRGCIAERMEESIGFYGEKPATDTMFFFDFVKGMDMALHVGGYYLWKHSRRHRIYKFTTGLENEALQFADAITLGFEGNKQVEITAADLSPGDKSKLDNLSITATDIHTEWPFMQDNTYYSEDYSLSNN